MTKKIVAGLFIVCILISCGGDTVQKTDCNPNDVVSATKCLCELMDKEEAINDSDASDEEYNKAMDETDAMNNKIDAAIVAGKYTEDDLFDEAEKIGCEL